MFNWVLYILAFILSFIGVELFRRWSLKKKLLDIPNERSSHENPTPRGGGIVIVFLTLIFYLLYQSLYSDSFIWSYFLGGILIAYISWLDDIKNISIILRLACHILATLLVIYQIGYFEKIYLPYLGSVHLGYFGLFVTSIWVIWFINAFNFMDGIDGIAGIQTVIAAFAWALIGYFQEIDFYIFFGIVLFFVSFGFLLHNWHPAKVFLGDVGSAFLGYTFGVLPLFALAFGSSSSFKEFSLLTGILFVWFFFYDSILTLLKRILRRERIWQPHRQHLYQILVISKLSHSFVSLIYGGLSFLLVIAVLYFFVLKKEGLYLILVLSFLTLGLSLFAHKRKTLT